jgi:hypothetical protein
VSLFVASPEIEDRNAVEVGNWRLYGDTQRRDFRPLEDKYHYRVRVELV